MKKCNTKYVIGKTAKKVYDHDHLWTAEAIVDSTVASTKPAFKVVREEIIGGKVYKVLSF